MKISQIALQLYTLRHALTSPAATIETLRQVRKIGYEAVQVSGFPPETEPCEIARLLADEGLICCATHETPDRIRTAPSEVIERLRTLDCLHTAYPFPQNVDLGNAGEVDQLCTDLEKSGQTLHAAGMTLSYHNHAFEFRKIDGQTVFERILKATTPQHVALELDTYWIQYGGENPVAWCQRLAGRMPLIHLKDYGMGADNEPAFREIGGGTLDFPAIIAAADQSGCQWYIVEQDTCTGDPFEAIRSSFDYLRENFCH